MLIYRDYFTEPNILDFSPLAKLTNVKKMVVSGYVDTLDFAKDMKELQVIHFYAYSKNDKAFDAIIGLPKLAALVFSGHVDAPTDAQLKSLRSSSLLTNSYK